MSKAHARAWPLSDLLFLHNYTSSPFPSYFPDSWGSFSFTPSIHSLIHSLKQY